jgi:hypothetical protein
MNRKSDPVSFPSHYTQGTVECIDAIEAAFGDEGSLFFLQGQVLKYLWRYRGKGAPLQDLQKADWYLQRLIAKVEGATPCPDQKINPKGVAQKEVQDGKST